jgi:colanic acid/amylovoran biosynthesis protein
VSLVGELRKFRPDARFALMSHWPQLDGGPAQELGIDVVDPAFSGRAGRDRRSVEMLWRRLRCAGSRAWRPAPGGRGLWRDDAVARAYAEADLVIDLSGDSYRDAPGGFALAHHATFLAALSTGTPYALASQSLGPFRRLNGPLVRYFMNRAELVYIREQRTAAILSRLGVRPDRIEVAPDVAFALPAASPERIWTGERIDPDRIPRPWIALSLSAFALGLRPHGRRYLEEMIGLCGHLHARYDASIFLVPHELSPTPGGFDDRGAAALLRSRMGAPPWLHAIEGDYGPDVLKGLISRCDAAVAARMHAAIAGLSTGVPTIPVAWSHKYGGLMEDIGLAGYVWNQGARLPPDLTDLFDRLWERREPIRAHLRDFGAYARDRVSEVVGRLAALVAAGAPARHAEKHVG